MQPKCLEQSYCCQENSPVFPYAAGQRLSEVALIKQDQLDLINQTAAAAAAAAAARAWHGVSRLQAVIAAAARAVSLLADTI
jgi:hypothetical protein